MRGEWPLTIRFDAPGGKAVRLQFDLATDRAEMPIAAGGEPAGGAAGPGKMESGMPRYRAGELEVAIDIDPGTARVGDNTLLLELRGTDGQLLAGAQVQAHAEMPAMGAMPAMRAPVDLAETSPGQFRGDFNLSMRGEWPLTVTISHPQYGEKRLQFDLATDREGLAIAAGAAPVDAAGAQMAEGGADVITIDNRRRQMIGVQTGEVEKRHLVKPIRTVGRVTFDERLLSKVVLKYDAFVGDLKADYVGTQVEKGQVLFTIYSPELLAAQQEYLDSLKRARGRGTETRDDLLRAARQRLALWDMMPQEIRALEERGWPQEYIPIYAPRSGTLIKLNIADGSAARAGQTLLVVADLSRVWVEAEVFEADLDLVSAGTPADITLPYLPGREYEAQVEYVYPYLEGKSRTGRIRLTLDNPKGELKPEMYAEVSLQSDLGQRLSVPEQAIIVAGDSRVVFVDLGGGRLRPTRIETGRSAGDYVEVLAGLKAGDRVVTSGNFLIAAETRLKTGVQQW